MKRTKTEAEQTRLTIMKTALRLFANAGVHKTTLEQIAQAAGLTRGAVYWHFKNKNDLLQAIGLQVGDVLKQRMADLIEDPKNTLKSLDPLAYLEWYLLKILTELLMDEEIYQAFAILNAKCEYIDEYKAVLDRMVLCYHAHMDLFIGLYQKAKKEKCLRLGFNGADLAADTYAFLSGLIRLILIERYSDKKEIEKIVKNHIKLRRLG